MRARHAGSDIHWAAAMGKQGIICIHPLAEIDMASARLQGNYTIMLEVQVFHLRQLASVLANRPM